jgi:hypothetical protein
MNETCRIQTSNATRCFSKGENCAEYCEQNRPLLVTRIQDYFMKDIKAEEYCIFIKYVILDNTQEPTQTTDLDKDQFNNTLKSIKRLKVLSDKINDTESASIREPLLTVQTEIGIHISNLNFLGNILFTWYSEYISDILYTFKNQCLDIKCNQAFIDLVIWYTYKIPGYESFILIQDKTQLLNIINLYLENLRKLKEPIVINEYNYNWFIDTIISDNEDDINLIEKAELLRSKEFLGITFDPEFIPMYKKFIKIMRKKLTNVYNGLNDNTTCSEILQRKTNTYFNEINPEVKKYYMKF